jgi:predicted Zn-dependent protease with MMP-like domain
LIRLPRREFARLVRRAYNQAYARAPRRIQEALACIDVVVEEWPSAYDLASGLESTQDSGEAGPESLFGMYTGVPLPVREGGPGASGHPERIAIYRQPILRSCANRAQAEREIRITLWHELGHYLGMDEDDLDKLGYG